MKKQKLSKFLVAAIVCSTLFLACKKDDNSVSYPEPVKKLLFDWKITNITTPKISDASVDSSILKTCTSDDIIRFSLTGYDFQDGATKCDSTVYPYSKGSWAYDTNKDSIRLGATTPQKYLSWKVLKLNDSVLQVKYIDSLNPAIKLTKTISFRH